MCPGGFSSYVSAKEMYSIISIAGLTHAPGRTKKWKNPSKICSRFHNTWHQWKGGEGTGDTVPSPSLWEWNHNIECKPCWAKDQFQCVSVTVKSQAAVGTAWIQVYPTTQSKQTFQGLRWACLNASTLTICHVKSAGSALTTLGLWWRFQFYVSQSWWDYRELSGTVGAHTYMKPANEPVWKSYHQKSMVQDSVLQRDYSLARAKWSNVYFKVTRRQAGEEWYADHWTDRDVMKTYWSRTLNPGNAHK